MNKGGFTVLISLMVAVVLFILGMALAPGTNDTVDGSMGSALVNCSTTDDMQTKAVCTQLDLFKPLLTGLLFGLAGFVLVQIAS